jgi:hypothetical protein
MQQLTLLLLSPLLPMPPSPLLLPLLPVLQAIASATSTRNGYSFRCCYGGRRQSAMPATCRPDDELRAHLTAELTYTNGPSRHSRRRRLRCPRRRDAAHRRRLGERRRLPARERHRPTSSHAAVRTRRPGVELLSPPPGRTRLSLKQQRRRRELHRRRRRRRRQQRRVESPLTVY